MPSADADESTLRFFTGLPSSVTLTSSVVSARLPRLGERQDVRAVGEERAPGLDDLDAVCRPRQRPAARRVAASDDERARG